MTQVIFNDIFDFEFNGPSDTDQWEGDYRVIQWNNSQMMAELSQRNWVGSEIEINYPLVDIEHGETGEVNEPGFLLETINLSIFAHRSIWEAKGADGMMYTQTPAFGNGSPKWNKRYNFLAILQEAGDYEPVILTAKAHTGQFIYKAISQARKRTIGLVQRLTGRDLPGYLFWITLASPGKKGKRIVGSEIKNAIYPPVALAHDISKLKKPGIIALLKSLYVGDDIRDMYTSGLYEQGQAWAEQAQVQALLPAPAGNETPETDATDAQILADGTLWLPDLSAATPRQMKDCGFSTGLFEHQNHADRAFSKSMRDKLIPSDSPILQWEVWRVELENRQAKKLRSEQDAILEAELRQPMPQAQAIATTEDEDIPF